ncbi:MAG: hypothetical protein KJ077_10710 [Anaerolineae bacterium]|nr:hypothetical protein [Anaerolineae bacterium]
MAELITNHTLVEKRMMALFEPKPETLHSEPAEAAAKALAFYWSGFDPAGLEAAKLRQDIVEVTAILNEWTGRVIAESLTKGWAVAPGEERG